jgi:hypothetical protein
VNDECARRRYRYAVPAVLLAACLFGSHLASCSGEVRNPRVAVKRMIGAYGGYEKATEVKNFIGRGFIKRLTSGSTAESDPLDVFQKGELFKYRITLLTRGRPVGVRVTLFDGYEGYQYVYGGGRTEAPKWEYEMIKYRFPYVLTWVQKNGIDGEIVTGEGDEGVCLLRYYYGDDIVTLELDSKSWLVRSVEIGSEADPEFSYMERYGDYREVDGVPFPNRFSGFFRGRPYFENFLSVIEYGVDLPDTVFSVTVEDTLEIGRVVSSAKSEESK